MTGTYTTTDTFTMTHARRLAGKIVSDMNHCQRLYGQPSDQSIANYQEELAVLLHGGYIKSYEFGFKTSDGKRIVSWYYTPGPGGDMEGGDRSGGIFATADISSGNWFNYLIQNGDWFALSSSERERIEGSHPVTRTGGPEPTNGSGTWHTTRTYTSGGVEIVRKEYRP